MRKYDQGKRMIPSGAPSKSLDDRRVAHDTRIPLIKNANVILTDGIGTSQGFLDKDESMQRRRLR